MEIGKVIEIGDRKVQVPKLNPQRRTIDVPPAIAPKRERTKEPV